MGKAEYEYRLDDKTNRQEKGMVESCKYYRARERVAMVLSRRAMGYDLLHLVQDKAGFERLLWR